MGGHRVAMRFCNYKKNTPDPHFSRARGTMWYPYLLQAYVAVEPWLAFECNETVNTQNACTTILQRRSGSGVQGVFSLAFHGLLTTNGPKRQVSCVSGTGWGFSQKLPDVRGLGNSAPGQSEGVWWCPQCLPVRQQINILMFCQFLESSLHDSPISVNVSIYQTSEVSDASAPTNMLWNNMINVKLIRRNKMN